MKERLVGAAVLVAVAVWLVPWVLDGSDSSIESTGSSLELPAAEEPMPMRTQTLRLGDPEPDPSSSTQNQPAEPVAAVAERPAPAAPSTNAAPAPATTESTAEPAATPPQAVATAPPQPRTAAPVPAVAPPKPAVTTAAGGDWAVQLGSFGEEANARRIAQRASTFGYQADVSRTTSGGRTLFRVRVGPQGTRAEADATASALRAHGLEASVVAVR